MKVLTKAEFADESKLETKEVPFGKGKVVVTEISSEELQSMRKQVENENGDPDMEKFNYVLLTYAVVDEEGNRMFGDDETEVFKKMSPLKLNKILKPALELNGLTGKEGNDSEPTTDGSSTGE